MSKCDERDTVSADADQESSPAGVRRMKQTEATTRKQRPKGNAVKPR